MFGKNYTTNWRREEHFHVNQQCLLVEYLSACKIFIKVIINNYMTGVSEFIQH